MMLWKMVACVTAAMSVVCGVAIGGDASVPGDIPRDYTTLHCIGIRYFIKGDANANARVHLEYREAGAKEWRKAMPLFRVESAAMEENAPPKGTVLHAGSIFGLEPDTEYEVKLILKDPDGGGGERTIRRKTWAEPIAPKPKRTLYVAPGDGGGSGTKEDPFKGIAAANSAASPGDLFLVGEGVYEATAKFTKSGSAAAPIVWRGPKDGEAVVDGKGGKGAGVSAGGIEHVYFERLAVRNVRFAFVIHGSKHLVVRRCHFYKVGTGIPGFNTRRIFIADCHFEGNVEYPVKPKTEDRGIEISGLGSVVCYNRVHNFRDAIDSRKPWPMRDTDFHNNECYDCQDDGIELDNSQHNVRAYDNRITNCTMGITFQTSWGGPNYAIRNAMYNINVETFKLHLTPVNPKESWKDGPHRTSGGVLLHNTVVKKNVALRVWSNEGPIHHFYARNNLFVGSPAYYAIDLTPPMRWADFDHNGYVVEDMKKFARWGADKYTTFAEFQKGAGQEGSGMLLTRFAGVFLPKVRLPIDPKKSEPIDRNRLYLAENSPVIDKGEALPTINEDFSGLAPDLGAYEFGGEIPHYGPREEPTPRQQ